MISAGTRIRGYTGPRRLLVGVIQGLLLFLMFKAYDLKVWPATELSAFQGLLMPILFVPLAAIHGDGHLPPRTLFIWLTAATLVCGGIGAFDGYRYPGVLDENAWEPGALLAGLAVGLFLTEALLLSAHADGKRVPDYPGYFDAISKHAVQVVAAAAFAGALWLCLFLGAGLFQLIKLLFLKNVIEEAWFAIPVTTLAVAAAIHVTDVRHGLVRGLRTLALTLLSWLLPVITVIAAGFLISLPFTGLQPLWDTRFAAALLLAVAAVLIVLINAAYQDGASGRSGGRILRYVGTIAMALPAPLVAIAAYALFLRVAQYGWTTDRVLALACVAVGACFGIGYLAALQKRNRLEATNIAASFLAIAVLLSLFTPIIDPARISVASQVARLAEGRISPEKFDFKYLRFEGGRYGAAALARMEAGEIRIAGVAERARQAAGLTARFPDEPLTRQDLALNIAADAGKPLPDHFLSQDWTAASNERPVYPGCLLRPGERCEAFFLDLDADGSDEIILIPDDAATSPMVFKNESAAWMFAGTLPRRMNCPDMRAALRMGEVRLVPPRWSDIEIAGARMDMTEQNLFEPAECPKPE